jgi:hypothetical protein
MRIAATNCLKPLPCPQPLLRSTCLNHHWKNLLTTCPIIGQCTHEADHPKPSSQKGKGRTGKIFPVETTWSMENQHKMSTFRTQNPRGWHLHSYSYSYSHSCFPRSARATSAWCHSGRSSASPEGPKPIQNQYISGTTSGVLPVPKDLRKHPIQKDLRSSARQRRTQNHIISDTTPRGGVSLLLPLRYSGIVPLRKELGAKNPYKTRTKRGGRGLPSYSGSFRSDFS